MCRECFDIAKALEYTRLYPENNMQMWVDAQDSLKLMRQFCNLYSYARLIHCVAEEYANEPDWMISLREKLHWKMELLENGAAE